MHSKNKINTLTDYEKITPHFERKGQEHIFYNLIRDFNSTNPELEKVNCPFCGKDSPEPAFELESYLYNHCNICKSLYNSPRPTPEELIRYHSFIDETSKLYSIPASQKKNRIEMLLKPRWEQQKKKLRKLKVVFPVKRVLEVGPGIGYFTELIQLDDCSESYTAVEIEESYFPFLEKIPKLTLVKNSLENVDVLKHGDNNLIFINSVIEHPTSLINFFITLKKLLKKGGYIILTDMHAQGFDIEILKEKTPNITPINILQVGSIKGINMLCKRTGLKLIDIFSTGKLDVEIVYSFIKDLPQNNPISGLKNLLVKNKMRTELQRMLINNHLTGYNGYIITRE